MNNGKHVILHIVFDGILFDMVFPRFEQMQEYENMYLLGSLNLDKELEYIKNKEKIIRVGSLEAWGKIVNDEKIDLIYLHGLWRDYLKAIDYIRDNVKVMWWVYGMEIYENCFGYAPLMRMEIYKPKTLQFILNKCNSFRSRFGNRLIHKYPKIYDLLRTIRNRVSGQPNRLKMMLARIDYAFTPLPMELEELKKKNRYIYAKPFSIQGTRTKEPLVSHKGVGHVLLEHSANVSNNHLDLIEAMERLDLSGRTIHVPLNYGLNDMKETVKENAKFRNADINCIEDVLPFDKYKSLIMGCSHAVFGMLRQSGLGNIYLCIRSGVKIFFFKDSMLYKHFITQGYYVYSIEEDMTDEAILAPLTFEESIHNYELFYKYFPEGNFPYDQQFNKILRINE